MRYLYSLMFYVLTPFLLGRLWWKGRRAPQYRQRISERFLWSKSPHSSTDIWIHAVSLGEVIAVTPLIEALLSQKKRLLMTTTTPTGAQQVSTRFGDRVVHRYLPFDFSSSMNRFFQRNHFKLGLIMETEIWPNMIHQAACHSIPLLLINARLSQNSFRHYYPLRWFFRTYLEKFTKIYAQAEDDAKRFVMLGAPKEKVVMFGNVKFDLQCKQPDETIALKLQALWGTHRRIVIAASTHDNEEEQVLAQLRNLQSRIPEVILLIAPRHPERFQSVYELSVQMGYHTGRRSQQDTLHPDNDVVVLDSLGELLMFYHLSDYAFVGGSFAAIGGHNVLEPIAMGTPVLTGPHRENFKAICDGLEAARAIVFVDNASQLMEQIALLETDEGRKNTLVANATDFFNTNKGVVTRYMAAIETLLV